MATCRERSMLSEWVTPVSPISKLTDDDLLVEILIRLPTPRSAGRCKTVSKRWNSLISSPYFNGRFISRHQSINEGPPLLLRSEDHPQKSTILSFLPVPEQGRRLFSVFDSFKDLLLCGFLDLDYDDNELGRSYLVCNPFTKQWVALPLAPEKSTAYPDIHAGLVCQPRHYNSNNLELGDGQVFVHSYEYRFKVVCIYEDLTTFSVKLDVFCSESGEWTKDALVLSGILRMSQRNVVSCNGELFWSFRAFGLGGVPCYSMAAFNPFCPEILPTSIDISAFSETERLRWMTSISQGVLHIILYEANPEPPRIALTVWRLEEDRKSWRKLYELSLNETSWRGYEFEICSLLDLHPENPEIVFLQCFGLHKEHPILSCNLQTGELEFFALRVQFPIPFMMFQPRVSCWPTPIPRYEELRAVYDGSLDCLVQSSEATALPL